MEQAGEMYIMISVGNSPNTYYSYRWASMRASSSPISLGKPIEKVREPDNRLLDQILSQAIPGFLVKNYKWIILGLGVSIIFLGNLEHLSHGNTFLPFHYGETGFILMLLAVTGYLTHTLRNALAERTQAIETLRLKNELGLYLASSRDVAELSRRIVRRIAEIIPADGIGLYLLEDGKTRLVHTADLVGAELRPQVTIPPGMDADSCKVCLAYHSSQVISPGSCRQRNCPRPTCGMNDYCLPLVQDNQPIGLIFIQTPPPRRLTSTQVNLLENISADISSSLYLAMENQTRAEEQLAQKISHIQLEIARDLHDTLGQNISFLRMKLDALSEADLRRKTDLEDEIRQMYSVANESYDLMRGTLAILQSKGAPDLLRLFTQYAGLVSERALFPIEFSSQGEPKALSPTALRQLFYVFREALSNIEKYARASRVAVALHWLADRLEITIEDDGCGFDPAQTTPRDHYGLQFMRDRIRHIQGELAIHSAIGSGTKIAIQVPYADLTSGFSAQH